MAQDVRRRPRQITVIRVVQILRGDDLQPSAWAESPVIMLERIVWKLRKDFCGASRCF
jgi:hypothetical protein